MQKQQKVSLWIGNFTSQTALNNFLKENFTDDGDVSSQFMEAFQIDYIDHDFQEVYFYKNETSKEKIFNNFSYIDSFLTEIPETNWQQYNSIILLYNFEFQRNIKENKYLKFITTFEFTENEI